MLLLGCVQWLQHGVRLTILWLEFLGLESALSVEESIGVVVIRKDALLEAS